MSHGYLECEVQRMENKCLSANRKVEGFAMYIEDLEATNLRQGIRKSDLVSAYWPIMSKTNTLDNELDILKGSKFEVIDI